MSDEIIGRPEQSEGPAVTQISRRDALKSLGAAVPAMSALTYLPPGLDRAAAFVATLTEDQQQQQAFKPKFFNTHEWRTVRVLVDYIIPRDEKSGSATDAKVPEFMDFVLNDAFMTSDANRVSFHGGLGWFDIESRKRFNNKTFIQATDAERRQILDDIAWPRRAKPELAVGTAFFSRLRDMTASGFYSSALGWKDLQYMGHVFNPNWNGCPDAANAKLGVTQDVMATRIPVQRG